MSKKKKKKARHMEIKKKLTVTRGEGDNRIKRGRVKSRACTKDPWSRTMG